MTDRKTAAIEIDPSIHEQVKTEIKILNNLADLEYNSSLDKKKKKVVKPVQLTLRSYSEAALSYFMKNHIDPRSMGEEKDVLTEVRKLRNNVFSFMQVQERTYLMPFVQDVYELKNKADTLEDTSFDMLNLMEIFIDLLLAGLGLSEQEQEAHKARAAKMFAQKKMNHKPKKG
ncbi:hypothetical protein [Spirosoma flavum]|uniref:Uncharacterized protein n=1 Tax=Spirosoma flavum TaxID=2048557 RepID=A0ABW6AUS0_9BACT